MNTMDMDFLTMGKGIAGGFPFAGFAVSERVSGQLQIGDHGGVWRGRRQAGVGTGGNALKAPASYDRLLRSTKV